MKPGVHMLVSLAAVLVIAAGCSHTATPAPATPENTSSVIVQANDMATAAAAVEQVGGTITHELAIISAVGATLTPSQIESLAAMPGITIHADRSVATSTEANFEGEAHP